MSSTIEFTPEQLSVLSSTELELVVSAAAGAGKTLVLVERYFRHIEREGLSPDQILTITFTKKAAAEMKERIVQRLRDAGLPDQAQAAETGPIQTIHGFCERLLRENAIEAGLDPEFGIMGEGDSARLLDRCVKASLADSENPYAQDLIHGLSGKRSGGGAASLGVLQAAIQRLVRSTRDGGLSRLDLLEAYSDPNRILIDWRNRLLGECPQGVVPDLAGSEFANALSAAYRAAKVKSPTYVRARSSDTEDLRAAAQTCGLVSLAAETWRLFENEIQARQELDFTALEARAVALLNGSEAARARMGRAYRVVMIDETQDVNPMQHALLDQLKVGRKLMVGDKRQSIYGWRQADVGLFIRRSEQSTTLALTENHRSDAGILNFVNDLFRGLWDDHVPMIKRKQASATYEGVEVWEQRDADSNAVALQIADMIQREGIEPADIAVLVRASRYAGLLLQNLERCKVPARIAGGSERFYVRMEVRDLANVLRALVDPDDDFSLLAMLRSPCVGLSLDSIALLALRRPVSQALVGFEPPIDADRPRLEKMLEWYVPLLKIADRLPAWELIAEVMARSGFLEALARRRGGNQQIANVRKLLWMASEQPELGGSEFAEQIREIQELNHKEGDAPVVEEKANLVTIMTIHKAKGLQFPVVVVPDLHRPLTGRPENVEIDPRLPMVAAGFEGMNTPYLSFLADRRYQRERAEEERLLYVALTRAEHRLCVVAHAGTRKESLAKLVAKNIDLGRASELGLTVRDLSSDARE